MGLEAYSRSAAAVTWVEKDRQLFRDLKENLERITGGEYSGLACICNDALQYLTQLPPGSFDIMIADPPYDRDNSTGWAKKVMDTVSEVSALDPEGFLVLEQAAPEILFEDPAWKLIKQKTYGDTRLTVYTPDKA